ncbi:MAG: hypothetical protein IJN09_00315 [Oscillospiraceae bacterium]|nr:hypothetical protein [Oscillospiraceae bacterium]MBQ6697473.1 hypothetical protein [Oscillospiraceae bacterium]
MKENNFIIGTYDGRYNTLLGVSLPELNIVQSTGLEKHISKRHPNCLKYLDKTEEIISAPDYIGTNPRESGSFELIKQYDDNILIGIKLDIKNNYYYVATLHDIKQSKINNRLFSGRLKKISQDY